MEQESELGEGQYPRLSRPYVTEGWLTPPAQTRPYSKHNESDTRVRSPSDSVRHMCALHNSPETETRDSANQQLRTAPKRVRLRWRRHPHGLQTGREHRSSRCRCQCQSSSSPWSRRASRSRRKSWWSCTSRGSSWMPARRGRTRAQAAANKNTSGTTLDTDLRGRIILT